MHRCQLSIFSQEDSVLLSGGQSKILEDIWRTGGSFGEHLEDMPISTSFLKVLDEFEDLGSSFFYF